MLFVGSNIQNLLSNSSFCVFDSSFSSKNVNHYLSLFQSKQMSPSNLSVKRMLSLQKKHYDKKCGLIRKIFSPEH